MLSHNRLLLRPSHEELFDFLQRLITSTPHSNQKCLSALSILPALSSVMPRLYLEYDISPLIAASSLYSW